MNQGNLIRDRFQLIGSEIGLICAFETKDYAIETAKHLRQLKSYKGVNCIEVYDALGKQGKKEVLKLYEKEK